MRIGENIPNWDFIYRPKDCMKFSALHGIESMKVSFFSSPLLIIFRPLENRLSDNVNYGMVSSRVVHRFTRRPT